MEKLQIVGVDRRVVREAGCDVLIILTPRLLGDTPATAHFAALVATLCDHAARERAATAATALHDAVKAGRLFDFSPHVYTVTLRKSEVRGGVLFVLTATLAVRTAEQDTVTRLFFFDEEERFQRRLPRRAKKPLKSNKNT